MDSQVIINHNDIFALCSHIHTSIQSKEFILSQWERFDDGSAWFRIMHDFDALKSDIKDLNNIFALALNCAPDDVRDFFIHYDDIIANCPF